MVWGNPGGYQGITAFTFFPLQSLQLSFSTKGNHGEGESRGSPMILPTTWNLELLFESSLWNIDDTFKVEPSIFYPLVTINMVADLGLSIPVVVALLPDRASTTYDRMFNAIMGLPFVLSTMSSVFEKTCKLDYLP